VRKVRTCDEENNDETLFMSSAFQVLSVRHSDGQSDRQTGRDSFCYLCFRSEKQEDQLGVISIAMVGEAMRELVCREKRRGPRTEA